jgi:DNA-binding CsgD family transcriptional regulator
MPLEEIRENKSKMAIPKVSTSPMTSLGKAPQAPHILAAGLEALEMLNIGVAVTNSLRRVLFANQTAEQILLSRDGLELTDHGVLQPVSKWSNPALARVMQQAAQVPPASSQETRDVILAIRRPSGKRPFTLLVRSLKARSSSDPGVPSVLVFVWDPEFPEHDTEVGLRELFGFTSCEARLANLLMKGKSVDDCCNHLAIRPSTVRMHLANLFAKTGVQRQGQLVSLLWKSVGIVRTKYDACSLQSSVPSKSAGTPTPPLCTPGTRRELAVRALTREFGL